MITRQIADLLNDAFRCDPEAVKTLVRNRVPCNESLANHPRIIVQADGVETTVCILGILNGLTDKYRETVCVKLDEETLEVVGFGVTGDYLPPNA